MTNDDVLLVPVTAVSKKGTDNYVWLYDDETQKIKKAEELDPVYADLAKPTKLVKEVWLEQVAKQTPGIDSNFVTNNLTSSISLQKNCEEC
ncbi:hypothetical protein QK901_02455 [Streptococcus thermophilus]|uniref:hypothetical protein n=1 Tax=Streptococcus thermophilus TaxID=1308 RepID=UPI003A7F6959